MHLLPIDSRAISPDTWSLGAVVVLLRQERASPMATLLSLLLRQFRARGWISSTRFATVSETRLNQPPILLTCVLGCSTILFWEFLCVYVHHQSSWTYISHPCYIHLFTPVSNHLVPITLKAPNKQQRTQCVHLMNRWTLLSPCSTHAQPS